MTDQSGRGLSFRCEVYGHRWERRGYLMPWRCTGGCGQEAYGFPPKEEDDDA